MPPVKYFVPNSFTALSLLLGLASITMSAGGQFELAAWMILWGTLLDKLDGTAARLLGASSGFGVQFDSFADFVTFGIAPAALVYYRVGAEGGVSAALLMVATGVYVVALAVRLARFNLTTGGESVFQGIPGTLMGALVAAGYLTWHKYQLDPALLRLSPAYVLVAAALMVSTLRISKLKLRKNRALNVFQVTNVVAAYIVGPLMLFPEYLFGLAAVYLIGGIGWGFVHRDESVAPAPDEPEKQPA